MKMDKKRKRRMIWKFRKRKQKEKTAAYQARDGDSQRKEEPEPQQASSKTVKEKADSVAEKREKKCEQAKRRIYRQKQKLKNTPEHKVSQAAVHRIRQEGTTFLHRKVSEAEQENAAVEGAHKTEQKVEEAYSFVKYRYGGRKARKQKKLAKQEKKLEKKEVQFQYEKFLKEHPEMNQHHLQKHYQKWKIKREYQKARKHAAASKEAQEAVGEAGSTLMDLVKKSQEMLQKHMSLVAGMGMAGLLVMVIMVAVSSCGALFADTQSMVLAASYLSNPKEIDEAELHFTQLESELQDRIDHIENAYPGYDEYTYNLDEIGHNPFTLINYLSAVHTEFTAAGVEQEIQELFQQMYTLTLTEEVETRGGGGDDEEEYEVVILRVTLTTKPLVQLVENRMNTEQLELYELYRTTGGLLQEFSSPLNLDWYGYVSSYYGYRKNPSSGHQEYHRGIDIAVPVGTEVYAAHDGIVQAAAYDSHYGNYVALEHNGYLTKYAHMNRLDVSAGQTVKKGDQIGVTGNSGSSLGSQLHLECLYQGEYYNPIFYFEVGEGTLYGEGATGSGGGAAGNVTPPESYDDASVEALIREAEKYLGYPYVWGGSTPATSFDCSGFVCWTFTASGVHNLPRTTAQGIYNQCVPVSPSQAKAGDIIFFTGTYNSAGPVSHVGIYCGEGVMIHCGDPIRYANINTPYWQKHFYSFGRLH